MRKFLNRDDVRKKLQSDAIETLTPEEVEAIEEFHKNSEEPEEPCDVEEPTSLTGVVGPPGFTKAATMSAHTHGTLSSGGMIGPGWGTSGPLPAYPPTTTTTGTIPWPIGSEPKPKKSKRSKNVRLPRRFTEKVLLAFLDEDESDPKKDVVWAANLAVERVEMTMENGEQKLVVVLSLEDTYDNNPNED